MTTAIRTLELSRSIAEIECDRRYHAALLVLRMEGRPVGQVRVPLEDGRASADAVERAVIGGSGLPVWRTWVERLTGGIESPSPAPPATVAICTRDRPEDLARCLESLTRLHSDGQEILVVDSASRDDATARVAGRFAGVRVVRSERPGLDVARNLALAEARNPLLAFIDDDATVEPDWLRVIAAPFVEDPGCIATTGLVLPVELETEAQELFERYFGFGRSFERRVFDAASVPMEQAWRCGVGAAMAMRREPVLDRLGGFDEGLDVGTPTRGGGDNDFFARVLAAGGRIHYRPDALAWHLHGRSSAALRRKFFGYGVSWLPFLRRCAMRGGRRQAWKDVASSFRRQAGRLVGAAMKRQGSMPANLLLAELAGWLAGPLADVASRGRIPPARHEGSRFPETPGPAPRPMLDPEGLLEIDLETGFARACVAVESRRPTSVLLRDRGEFVGLVRRAAGEPAVTRRELVAALRDTLRYALLVAWTRRRSLPAELDAPGWTAPALACWFSSLSEDPGELPDGVERFLTLEDRFRHVHEWIRLQVSEKGELAILERAMRESSERAEEAFRETSERGGRLQVRLMSLEARLRELVPGRPPAPEPSP